MADVSPTSAATAHQQTQAMPFLAAPLVDPSTGILVDPWYRFFIGLWGVLGGSQQDQNHSIMIAGMNSVGPPL